MTHPTPKKDIHDPYDVDMFQVHPNVHIGKSCTEADLEGTAHLPTIENEEGGRQSDTFGRFDLIPPEALIALAKVLGYGAKKYGPNNWHKIPLEDHINHAFEHLVFYLKGDSSEDHLAHCLTRLTFAIWARENRKPTRQQQEEYLRREQQKLREVESGPINLTYRNRIHSSPNQC